MVDSRRCLERGPRASRPYLLALLGCALLGCGWPGDEGLSCAAGELGIAELQGDGPISPHAGEWRTVRGVVALAHARRGSTPGFFLQADGAADPGGTAGAFVALGSDSPPPAVGERMRVRGQVEELGGVTALSSV